MKTMVKYVDSNVKFRMRSILGMRIFNTYIIQTYIRIRTCMSGWCTILKSCLDVEQYERFKSFTQFVEWTMHHKTFYLNSNLHCPHDFWRGTNNVSSEPPILFFLFLTIIVIVAFINSLMFFLHLNLILSFSFPKTRTLA